jgi:RNA polymerase sigma factor (sigma-70 family)
MPQRTPAQLARACQQGQPEAWDELLRRYARLIWSVAIRLGASEPEAEEVFQRTWVALIEGIHDLRQPDRVASWVAGTARYQTYRLFSEQGRQRRLVSFDEQLNEPAESAAQDRMLVQVQEATALYAALDRLDDRCRTLLTLLFFNDPPLDYEHVSQRTGLAVGSIGPIRARCLKRLRSQFDKLYQASLDSDQ